MRIAVFCPNLVGDTVMATPTFRALRRGFPDAKLMGVIKPQIAATIAGNPWFDEILPFAPRSRSRQHRAWAVIRRLRRERIDLAILLPNSFRSAAMAWLGGARRIVGYARGGRSLLLTDRLVPPQDDRGRFVPVPIVGYYLALARHVGCQVDSLRYELATTTEDEAAADSAFHDLGISAEDRLICLNQGGAFGPAKRWPDEFFAELARRLAEEDGRTCLVVCGPSEIESARRIVELAAHPRVLSLAHQPLSIGLTKACVRRSALLITTDSGPRHFAAAFGVPVVSLFGPTHIAWTRTYHPRAIHLAKPVPCGPCQQPTCLPGHHRCMRELSPGEVLAAARQLLGHAQGGRATPHRATRPVVSDS